MASQYPEQWSGWLDHARQGGSLFDSPASFVALVEQCWQHYVATSDIFRAISLSPPPLIQISFRPEALQHPDLQLHFQHLQSHFAPTLHGITLPFAVHEVEVDSTTPLQHIRNFTFQWTSQATLPLRCFFYLDQQFVGGLDLGQIQWLKDQRRLAVQRSFLGRTKQSDISACFQASPYHVQLPPKMQRDLTFLGWDFVFTPQSGDMFVSIQNIASQGYLEGGDFLLRESQQFQMGESIDFYQGLSHDTPDSSLRCRMLIVPAHIQPTAPVLSDIAIIVHGSMVPSAPPHLEILAQIKGMTAQDTTITLQLEPGTQTVTLHKVGNGSETGSLFRATSSIWNPAWEHGEIRCIPQGQNHYGLAFPPHLAVTTTPRHAIHLRYEGPTAIPKSQLQREWELTFLMEPKPTLFDLNDLTLHLRGSDASTLRIPLANLTDHRLIFRYLPRYASQQVDLHTWERGDVLSLWVEQDSRQDTSPFDSSIPILSHNHNQPEQPLLQLRILDLDDHSQLLPTEKTVTLPEHAELVLEGHRLQVVGPLTLKTDNGSLETWDLLLITHPQARHIELIHQEGGWMQPITTTPSSSTSSTSRNIRSLWLSCGHKETWIDQPRERNPLGGPCLAFGLGFGSQNEMAQIRPSSHGFRLFRHRNNIAVFANGQPLPVEPYDNAEGFLLGSASTTGWLLVDRGFLRYRVDQVHGTYRLSLQLLGYLLKRPDTSNPALQILCGETQELLTPQASQYSDISQLRLTEQGHPTVVTLSLPQAPVLHTYPALHIQDRRNNTLAQPLRYGAPYRRNDLSVSFWQLLDPQTRLVPQHLSLPELPILLDCNSMFGRYRYSLVQRRGRLGYWYAGSQFIENMGESEPLFSPDYSRTTPQGVQIPANTLLMGSDNHLADLLLPPILPWSYTLPFGISLHEQSLTIIPMEAPCSLWTWQLAREGCLLHQETTPQSTPITTTLPQQGRVLLRCEHILFEISTHPEDRKTMPQAEITFSIRGMFFSAQHSISVGGASDHACFPIADPIPSLPSTEALFQLYTPSLSLCYRGEGIVALRQTDVLDTMRARLQQELTASPISRPQPPMSLLWQWVSTTSEHPQYPQPALQHERPSLSLPEGFLRHDSFLHIESTILQYHLRQRVDLYPSPERVPAWLRLQNQPSWFFPFDPKGDGFLSPPSETLDTVGPFAAIYLGRYEEETTLPQEAFLSTHLHNTEAPTETPILKINLFGFVPRLAASLIREQDQCFFVVPAPKNENSYHIVWNNQPVYQAGRFLLDQPAYFHINHLVVCAIFPETTGIRFELSGYLLGHQHDPARPVVLGHTNTVGCIHLHTSPYPAKIALQRSVCPPHFLLFAPEPVRTWEPAPLHSSLRVGLVDLQHETSQHPALHKPMNHDRLLWFDGHSPDTDFLFPPTSARNSFASSSNFTSNTALSEGSSFFFDHDHTSQGSSFFFDPPVQFTTPEPVSEASNTTEYADSSTSSDQRTNPNLLQDPDKDQDIPTVAIGWFPTDATSSPVFGIRSQLPGPRMLVRLQQGRWRIEPDPSCPIPETAENMVAFWRHHHWHPLQVPVDISDELWLRCGCATFSITPRPETQQILLRYRWLWLPSHESIAIHGNADPSEPIKTPTIPTSIDCFLTSLPSGFYTCVLPTQRGHRVEVKSGLSLQENVDHCFVVSTPTEKS